MHALQPKHSKLNKKEQEEVLVKYNISKSQLPKIKLSDPAIPEGCQVGDVVKIDRKSDEETYEYFRVVIQ